MQSKDVFKAANLRVSPAAEKAKTSSTAVLREQEDQLEVAEILVATQQLEKHYKTRWSMVAHKIA